ncbi:manganese ABC transporter [Paenibacillus sp. PK3_47]|uniref:metal ABC transporter permease n=1 Tax=Paenibacillus sp. PK3_47 TaxID=2072642 RepID=UPI00201DDC05|nr:iron chelate uptake ABC transporter family permease subunit [Paenibacillus sp. PK3_47]UQZ36677.1 manganese ABC transporter [Paenibacillus sp. PK3_47]
MDFAGLSPNTLWVLFSTLILGVASGLIGCLAYWKRQSLMSDALSHAALPGIIIAFSLTGTKSVPVLMAGAALSAFIGFLFIQWIQSSTKIKEDTAMGIVLSIFFGLGIMLLSIVNRTAGGGQSGLDHFIFGQAASMTGKDVRTMSVLAFIIIAIIWIGFKEWKLYLFDADFARGLGMSGRLMNGIYMALLILVIVIGIQAVGVILMAALLIIPPVSARYWTHSFKTMLILSAVFGGGAGAAGTWVSTLGKGWPTGPFIVLLSSSLFLVSLIFGFQKGLVAKRLQLRALKKQSLPPLPSHMQKGEI